ncbi:hypothetical protein IJT93_02645 [bacterium]|nr:hypothetical protein [bacterium]
MVKITNFLCIFTAACCLIILAAEIYLAVCGHIIVIPGKANVRYYQDEEVEFIENAGWGNPQGQDNEEPNVFIHCWDNGMRRSRENENKAKKQLKVAMVGCSFIFGLGVKDYDTMVWHLNEKYPDVVFDNWGLEGAGPLQIYARIEHILQHSNDYDLIVYNGYQGQMSRNCVPRATGSLRLNGLWLPVPYAEHDLFGRYKTYFVDDQRYWGEKKSLVIDLLKRSVYLYYTKRYQEKYSPIALSNAGGSKEEKFVVDAFTESINNMKLLCDKYNKDFLVCVLEDRSVKFDGQDEFYILSSNPGLHCETVNVSMPGNEQMKAENRVMNHVGYHPNAKVHAYWAEKFSEYFDKRYESVLNKKQ